jgi:Tfp pilus assembly protein PilX
MGIALPVALMLLFIIASVAAALMASAIAATSQSRHDRGVKQAVAAADAGLDAANYRINKLTPGSLGCVVRGATSQLVIEPVQPDGWCRAQTEDLGGGASFSYRVRAAVNAPVNGQQLVQRTIVSTGTVNGVSRRVSAVVGSATGASLFGDYAVISLEDLPLWNSARIEGNVGSNGNIKLTNSAEICGNATPGPGKLLTTSNSAHLCAGFISTPATAPFVLNPIDQGNAATVNNNALIGGQDVLTKPAGVLWDPATRSLTLRIGATLTLTGNVYSFCSLELDNNSELIIAPRDPAVPVKIYIDSPENCPGVSNAGSVRFRNGGGIVNMNADPTTVHLYLGGSATTATNVSYDNNFQTAVNMLIYAPESTVTFSNHTHIVGAVAAKSVVLQNNTEIKSHERVGGISVDGLKPLFQRQSWTECTVTNSGPTPDAGC